MPILYIIVGFILLIGGAEILVRGASSLALRIGLSPLVIGLTVVAVGTSSPELAVSVKASLGGTGGIALGNIVGSNICNVGLILGAAALIFPLSVELQTIRREIPILLAASVLFLIFIIDGSLDRYEGIISIVVLSGYLLFLIRDGRKNSNKNGRELDGEEDPTLEEKSAAIPTPALEDKLAAIPTPALPLWLCIAFIVAGLVALIFGSRFAVIGAVEIAARIGFSEAVIGLTVVALGTSLPELVTSCVAAAKREADIAVGNVIGSNLFNLLLIGGLASTLKPVDSSQLDLIDFGVMMVFTILLLPFLRTGFRLSRWEGGVFLAGYVVYMGYLVLYAT